MPDERLERTRRIYDCAIFTPSSKAAEALREFFGEGCKDGRHVFEHFIDKPTTTCVCGAMPCPQ